MGLLGNYKNWLKEAQVYASSIVSLNFRQQTLSLILGSSHLYFKRGVALGDQEKN